MVSNLDLKLLHAPMRDELLEAITRVVDSGWFLLGNELSAFEADFARYCETEHCIGVANGLDALILVLQGWQEMGRLKAGDTVLVPANTFFATVLAVTAAGLVPKFVEPDAATHNIDVGRIAAAITPEVKAIIAVHLYGRAVEMARLMDIADAHRLLVLEDSAQAHGATSSGRPVGGLGHASGFSFYPAKNLGAMGDGGAITTNDGELAQLLRSLRNYGSGAKYFFDFQGRNSRLDEIQAAVLAVKLRHIATEIAERRAIAARYGAELNGDLFRLPDAGAEGQHVWHQYVVRTPERAALLAHLAKRNIHPIIHYPRPPYKQRAYPELNNLSFPVAEQLAEEVLSLPIHSGLTEAEVSAVISAVNSFESGA